MVSVVYLAEQLARSTDYVIETMGAPDAVGGLAIAVLVATLEAIGAVRASLANSVQRGDLDQQRAAIRIRSHSPLLSRSDPCTLQMSVRVDPRVSSR